METRDPGAYAAAIEAVLGDPEGARRLSEAAAAEAAGYTWSTTAARLRRLYTDLTTRTPVSCL
jgi:D-inositol-3-phosphate glycosyltransferase